MKIQVIKIFILLALLGFVLTFNKARAQAFEDKVWSAGPEIGVNFSSYGGSENDVSKAGVQGGAFMTYSIRNTHAFTGKLLLSQRGAKFDGIKQTLTYLEIPVLARIFFNTSGVMRPNVFAGPTFGFLAGANNKADGTSSEVISNPRDQFNSFDFGLTAGLGLNYEFAPETRFLIDARYLHGFSDITKASSTLNHNVFGVSFGLSFGI
jgi:hypothetical protein